MTEPAPASRATTGGTGGALDALTRRERGDLRQLLIAAVAAAGRPDIAIDLGRLVAAAPIRALPEAAELHRVSGTVLRGVEGIEGVPDDVRAGLDDGRVWSSMRHLLVAGVLSEVQPAFEAAGIGYVVMKGPIVAGLLYPAAGDRSYADLDVLVTPAEFPRAMEILEDLGYRSKIHNWALAEAMLAGQIGMVGPTLEIDLHWELHYSREDRRPLAFAPDEMVARARRVDVGGIRTPTLDAPDTLVTLAFHAARSGGHRLVWLKDVERALTIDQPDLDEVVRRARAYRCAPAVGVVLGRARTLLAADVPDSILRAMTPASLIAIDRLATRVAHPVQLHERSTITRWLTRSVRSSLLSSLLDTPRRTTRFVAGKVHPPKANDTDDPIEKARYLAAVSRTRPGARPA